MLAPNRAVTVIEQQRNSSPPHSLWYLICSAARALAFDLLLSIMFDSTLGRKQQWNAMAMERGGWDREPASTESESRAMVMEYNWIIHLSEIIGNLFALRDICFLILHYRIYVDSIVPRSCRLHRQLRRHRFSVAFSFACISRYIRPRCLAHVRDVCSNGTSNCSCCSERNNFNSFDSGRQTGVFGHNKRQSLPGKRYSQFERRQRRLHNWEFPR